MAASLTIQFTDPPAAGNPNQDAVRFAVQTAFNEWTQHFDYTAGTYSINVAYKFDVLASYAALIGGTYVKVGSSGATSVVEIQFGLSFAARNGTAPTVPALTLLVDPFDFMNTGLTTNIVAPVERELEHELGVRSFRGDEVRGPIPPMSSTVYDGSVRGDEYIFGLPRPPLLTTFFGPNAYAAYGQPVPLLGGDASYTIVHGGVTVDTDAQSAATVQPLDVALLRDSGLPALSDQELAEHQVARLYNAAFGPTPTAPG